MQRLVPYQLLYALLFLPLILFFREQFLPLLIPLIALPIFWHLHRGRPLPRSPFNLSLLILFGSILISLWATPDLSASLRKVVALLYSLLLFFTLIAFAKTRRTYLWVATTLTLALALSLVIVGFLARLSFITARIPQLSAVSPNENELAGVITYCLFLLLPITFALLLSPPKNYPAIYARILGVILLLGSGVVILALFTTRSRGGWISGVAAVGLFIFFMLKRPFNYLVALLTFLGMIMGGWWLFSSGALEHGGTATLTLSGRVEIWSRAIYALQDFPFTGVGMNIFREIIHLLYPLFTISPTIDLGHAHNQFLQAGVDLGIPGLIAYMSLWLGSVFLLWQAWINTRNLYLRVLIAGLSATLLAHFTYGIVDAIALGARPNFLLWMIFGLVVSVHHHATLSGKIRRNSKEA